MAYRAQMFIGEMGCWLVVFGFYLWNRFVAPRFASTSPLLAGGYQRVSTDTDGPYESDEEANENSSLTGDTAPAVRPLLPNDDSPTKLSGQKILMLAAPACCDITGTTLMNVGLLFVVASIYQMTRGALVLFVGLFSVLFLRHKLYLYQWLALLVVVLGVAIVGLAGAIFPDESDNPKLPQEGVTIVELAVRSIETTTRTPEAVQAIIGVLLIAGAQVFTASQFVLEEWILENYAMEPIRVVGWEGIFGFIVTIIGMIILHLAVGQTDAGRYGYFDAKEGWKQMTSNKSVALSSILIMISIGYALLLSFNFHGRPILATRVMDFVFSFKITLLISLQWLQLLRSKRHTQRLRYLPQHNRHLPYPLHLARILRTRLGIL